MTTGTAFTEIARHLGIEQSDIQFNGTQSEALQLRALMDEAGQDITRRGEWRNLFKRVSLAPLSQSQTLPADFQKIAATGVVEFAPYQVVQRCVSPELWAFLQSTSHATPRYRLMDASIEFSQPVPADGGVMEYISSHWCGDGEVVISESTEINIPERLLVKHVIWSFKRMKGMPFDDALAEYEAALESELRANRGVA